MPTFSTELFEIRVRQEYLDQEIINLYYYTEETAGSAIAPQDVCTVFNDDVQRLVEDIQQQNVNGIDIRCRKFGGLSETIVDISLQSGNRLGEPIASFNAWGYILNRTTIDVRNGSKRYAGISEDDAEGNTPATGVLQALSDLADALSQALDTGGGDAVVPVVYRRESFIDPDWFGTKVASAQFTAITSQVSRKQLLS